MYPKPSTAEHPESRGTLWSRDGGELEAPLADLSKEAHHKLWWRDAYEEDPKQNSFSERRYKAHEDATVDQSGITRRALVTKPSRSHDDGGGGGGGDYHSATSSGRGFLPELAGIIHFDDEGEDEGEENGEYSLGSRGGEIGGARGSHRRLLRGASGSGGDVGDDDVAQNNDWLRGEHEEHESGSFMAPRLGGLGGNRTQSVAGFGFTATPTRPRPSVRHGGSRGSTRAAGPRIDVMLGSFRVQTPH